MSRLPPELVLAPAPPDSLLGPPLSRRDLLGLVSKVVVGGAALVCGAGALRLAMPNAREDRPPPVCVGSPADFRMGTTTFLAAHELFVLHAEAGFAAISSRCTHLGCAVRRTSDGFACPCHGAHYDEHGEVTSGPARRPLAWLELHREGDGKLWVDKGREVAPGAYIA